MLNRHASSAINIFCLYAEFVRIARNSDGYDRYEYRMSV